MTCNVLYLITIFIVIQRSSIVFCAQLKIDVDAAKVSVVFQSPVRTTDNSILSQCLDLWSDTNEIGEIFIIIHSNDNHQLFRLISRDSKRAKKIRLVIYQPDFDFAAAKIINECKFPKILVVTAPIKFNLDFFSLYPLRQDRFFWHPSGLLYAESSALRLVKSKVTGSNKLIASLYFSIVQHGQVAPILIQSNSFLKLSRGYYDCQKKQSDVLALQSSVSQSFFNATSDRIQQSLQLIHRSSHLILSQYATLLARPAGSNMILHAKQGLGNRMRALLTASTIAAACNLTLTLVWEIDEHMGALFQELFKRPEQVASVFHSFDQRLLHLARFKIYNYMEWELTGHKNEPIECPKNQDIYVKSAFSLVGPSNLRGSVSSALFQPASAVRQLIQSVPLGTVRKCVGVHIRMQTITDGDLHNIHGNEADAMSEANRYRRACHFSHFVEVMKEKFPPGACFFVSIDVREYLLKIIENMGPHRQVLFLPTTSLLVDRTKRSVQFALANMFLLSRTKYLLTSHWSSFSEMAVKLGSLPSENACSLV